VKSERFYPRGQHYATSAGPDVAIRLGGRRTTLVLRFDEPIGWVAFGVLELRRFHAILGRHLRELEARQVTEVLDGPRPDEPDDDKDGDA
jgi:hypothetical protein